MEGAITTKQWCLKMFLSSLFWAWWEWCAQKPQAPSCDINHFIYSSGLLKTWEVPFCFLERDLHCKQDNGLPHSPNRSVAAVVIKPVSNSCALPLKPSSHNTSDDSILSVWLRNNCLCSFTRNHYTIRIPVYIGGASASKPFKCYVLIVVFIEASLFSSLKSKRFRKDCLLNLHFYSDTQNDWFCWSL